LTVFVLALLPVLYVLSIGPAAMLAKRGYFQDGVHYVYVPVIWLHDHTPLKLPLELYVSWWES
jgi:hypothetical protein